MAALIYCIFDRAAGPLPAEDDALSRDLFCCYRCGRVIYSGAAKPIRKCPKPITLPEQAASLAAAGAKWAAAGFPMRSEAEILRILETHCQACEHFDPTAGRCVRCGGCYLSGQDKGTLRSKIIATVGKLAMATEKCPVGKFPADRVAS